MIITLASLKLHLFPSETNLQCYVIAFLLTVCPYIALTQTGPGGIGNDDGSTTLEYWIDANRGATVNGLNELTTITDLSGNGVTNTINSTPTVETNVLNTLNVMRFNGTDESIQTNLDIEEATYPNLTAITVYIPAVAFSQTVWGAHAGGYPGRYLTDNNLASPTTNNLVGPGYQPAPLPHGASQIAGLFPTGSSVITSVVIVEDAVDGTDVRVDGNVASSFTSDHDGDVFDDLSIANASGSDFWFDGDIAEVIFFGEELSELQLIIVENYLSAKYGIALTANDIYTGDNTGFDFDVAGIGRIDAGNIHDDSRGTGIVTIRNPSDLGDNEYLFIGRDAAALTFNESSDIPAEISSRLESVWSNTEVGDVGTIDIRWDLSSIGSYSPNELAILVDSDNDGLFNDETAITGAADLGSNVFEFAGVSALSSGLRFTLATLAIPLPVELVYFDVEEINYEVKMIWSTATESNNDYFTIEKSIDGWSWSTIGTVSGAGSSNELINYSFIDQNPHFGTSYYRLKQTDFDGAFEYSKIVAHHFKGHLSRIQPFPNPSSTYTILYGISKLAHISLFDMTGKNMSHYMEKNYENDQLILSWDSSIPTGIYSIQIHEASSSFSREIIIK